MVAKHRGLVGGLMSHWPRILTILMLFLVPMLGFAEDMRVKDLGKLQGWRDNALVGWGIATGLAGSGDSPGNRATRQALSNVMTQFNLAIPPDQIQARNVAVVMVSAALPTFAREGDKVDVTVTSAGDARSLVGGTLLMTPLKAANGRTYAIAQGPVTVGGFRFDANGNMVQKNHPTVGSVPGGATVEVGVSANMMVKKTAVTFVLDEPDYTTAQRVAYAINAQLGDNLAKAQDAAGIDVEVPAVYRDRLVEWVARMENVTVEPDRRAKVVINERTGTVVSGGNVRISRVAISHGDVKINVQTQHTVSQPHYAVLAGPGVRTARIANSTVGVDEASGPGFVAVDSPTVADLVQTLNQLRTSTRDVISILRAIKAAGALHAELVVQ